MRRRAAWCVVGVLLASVGVLGRQQITSSRLVDTGKEPQNWLTYFGNYAAWSYSSLDQITRQNVKQLVPVWAFPTGELRGGLMATPLVADGVMYLMGPRNRVFALGWGLGAALVGIAGAVLAIFYYIHPQVGGTFALIAYVTVALGGFGSIFGALVAGVIVGLVEALTTLILPASLKSVGVYSLYLLVLFVRPSGLFGRL